MRSPKKRLSILPLALLGIIILCALWAGYYLYSQPPSRISETLTAAVGVQGGEPDGDGVGDPAAEQAAAEPEGPVVILETVRKGETAGELLEAYLSAAEIQTMATACEEHFSLRRLRAGQPYAITIDNGTFVSFIYEIDADKKLIVQHQNDTFSATVEDIVYDVTVEHVQGAITSHLFQAVDAAGETPLLAINLADIFAWEINFIRDIHPGDSFNLLVEKRYREGEFKGYGRILAAEFSNQGAQFDAYAYRDADGVLHYYNRKGESVKRAFLKAPLSFTRISSKFSNNRRHPTLNVWRAHPAVDYAAPSGTPVKAVGSGVVTFKGWGKGAGNYIALRHNNKYETMYLHLSAFAKGLVKGKKVVQGEVIGFVGSTGYSTGPHLDFRMKKDGTYINPLTIASPRTEPVARKDMPEFTALVQTMQSALQEAMAKAGASPARENNS